MLLIGIKNFLPQVCLNRLFNEQMLQLDKSAHTSSYPVQSRDGLESTGFALLLATGGLLCNQYIIV